MLGILLAKLLLYFRPAALFTRSSSSRSSSSSFVFLLSSSSSLLHTPKKPTTERELTRQRKNKDKHKEKQRERFKISGQWEKGVLGTLGSDFPTEAARFFRQQPDPGLRWNEGEHTTDPGSGQLRKPDGQGSGNGSVSHRQPPLPHHSCFQESTQQETNNKNEENRRALQRGEWIGALGRWSQGWLKYGVARGTGFQVVAIGGGARGGRRSSGAWLLGFLRKGKRLREREADHQNERESASHLGLGGSGRFEKTGRVG